VLDRLDRSLQNQGLYDLSPDRLWFAATENDIEGVLFGACEFGANNDWMKEFTEGSALPWMCGYSASVDWLTSTMIDLAVRQEMATLSPKRVRRTGAVVEALASALSVFNPDHLIDDEPAACIRHSVVLVAQSAGRGQRAHDLSDDLRTKAWPAP